MVAIISLICFVSELQLVLYTKYYGAIQRVLFNYHNKLKGIFYCFYFLNKETKAQKHLDTFPGLTVGYTALQLGILLFTVIKHFITLVHMVIFLDSPARF